MRGNEKKWVTQLKVESFALVTSTSKSCPRTSEWMLTNTSWPPEYESIWNITLHNVLINACPQKNLVYHSHICKDLSQNNLSKGRKHGIVVPSSHLIESPDSNKYQDVLAKVTGHRLMHRNTRNLYETTKSYFPPSRFYNYITKGLFVVIFHLKCCFFFHFKSNFN